MHALTLQSSEYRSTFAWINTPNFCSSLRRSMCQFPEPELGGGSRPSSDLPKPRKDSGSKAGSRRPRPRPQPVDATASAGPPPTRPCKFVSAAEAGTGKHGEGSHLRERCFGRVRNWGKPSGRNCDTFVDAFHRGWSGIIGPVEEQKLLLIILYAL